MAPLFSAETRLGVRASEKSGKPGGVEVSIDAIDKDDAKVEGVAVHVDLFHVTPQVAKEQLAPFVYRYRNTHQFAKVASQDIKTTPALVSPAMQTGRYVLLPSAPAANTS